MGTNEEAMNSLILWMGTNELHPHFVGINLGTHHVLGLKHYVKKWHLWLHPWL
jgi:hypothetical protein